MANLAGLKRLMKEGPTIVQRSFPKKELVELVPESAWGETFHHNDRRYYQTPGGGRCAAAAQSEAAFRLYLRRGRRQQRTGQNHVGAGARRH